MSLVYDPALPKHNATSPSFPSSSAAVSFNAISNGLLFLEGLRSNLAETMEQCLTALARSGLQAYPHYDDGSLWCNATWDTVLCWPATRANTRQCPPLKGLDPTKNITKFCHASGRWMGKTENDFSRSHGWTNFTMCFTQEVVHIMKHLNNGSLGIAQDVAKNARKLEFVGLGLSFTTLLISILIFSCFRRLRVFRNMLHLQLMIAILICVIIRLILYVDLIFTDQLGHVLVTPEGSGRTINTMVILCELMFFLLEYFKSVAFWWMFLEGFHLHNQLVLTVFTTEAKLWPFLLTVIKKQGKVERCLGSYYLEPEFWILDGPRMLQLVVNTFFISNVIRVLWTKVRDSHNNSSEVNRMKKSVKAALMLIPLLGIPNIMQTIPFSPTHENITYFTIWTYVASFTYMYQGLIISIIYCFTNREVIAVIKTSITSYCQIRNGNDTTSFGEPGYRKESKMDGNQTSRSLPAKMSCDCRSKVGDMNGIRMVYTTTASSENHINESTPLKKCSKCENDPSALVYGNDDAYDDDYKPRKSTVTFLTDPD
ncbi:7 transmembrane receptor (Secretin family) domain-containing protein [Ditylenchus destructor]|nr:7 transmembrane receptor (Secretin family) domain-containing protein [Ditylenchus destructor]